MSSTLGIRWSVLFSLRMAPIWFTGLLFQHAEAIRCLEMDSLERRTVGLKKIAETNQNDNKVIAKVLLDPSLFHLFFLSCQRFFQEKLREEILKEIECEKERLLQERIVSEYLLGTLLPSGLASRVVYVCFAL